MRRTKISELRDAMERDRAETMRLLTLFSDEEFARRAPGEWSAGEILQHLLLAETGTSKVIRKVLKDRAGSLPPYPADDSGLRVRPPRIDPRTMEAPEIAVPREIPPRAELLARAAECREQTLKSLEMLSPFDPTAGSFPHPVFGEMTLYEWVAVIVVGHEKQHHDQLRKIARAFGKPTGGIGA